MIKWPLFLSLSTCLILLPTCKNTEQRTKPSNQEKVVDYLFLAHTRTEQNPQVITEVESVDFSNYEMLWLGGDLAQLSSENEETLHYLDSVFDLKNENTFWALGNHDYTNPELIEQTINKPRYYVSSKNGLTIMVLDTQDSLCHITGKQLDMFNNTVDTLSKSSHLIILHHKLLWLYGNSELEPQATEISNAPIDSCSYCINPNNFYQDLYPKLIELQNKNIEVICVGGDIGFKTHKFEHQTPEGIYFLASGMSFNESQNYSLVFQHNLQIKQLKWSFTPLEAL